MIAKLLTLLSAFAATVLAQNAGDATYFTGTVAQGACADKNPVRSYNQTTLAHA